MERILVAVDYSPYLDKILGYLGRFTKNRDDIFIVFLNIRQSCLVFDDVITETADKDIILQRIEEMKRNRKKCREEQNRHEEVLSNRISAVFPDDSQTKLECVEETGEYAQIILDKAKEFECSTIVLGKKGDSIISEYLIGSTAEKVSRKARGFTIWLVD